MGLKQVYEDVVRYQLSIFLMTVLMGFLLLGSYGLSDNIFLVVVLIWDIWITYGFLKNILPEINKSGSFISKKLFMLISALEIILGVWCVEFFSLAWGLGMLLYIARLMAYLYSMWYVRNRI